MKQTCIHSIIIVLLKELRLAAGCTQRTLASHINIGSSCISMIEKGTNNLTMDNFLKISYALKQSPSDVVSAVERYAMWLEKFLGFNVSLKRIPLKDDEFFYAADAYYIYKKKWKIDLNSTGVTRKDEVLHFPKRPSVFAKKSEINRLMLVGVFYYISIGTPYDPEKVMEFFGKDFAKNYEAFKRSKVGVKSL